MIKTDLQQAFNKQINEELFSAYLYVSMVNYFESQNLKGFAAWMRAQVVEELIHANKLIDYMLERGGDVKLEAIGKPESAWDNPLAAFEAAYAHECHISACINDLYSASVKAGDHAAAIFLNWFVSEQVEEEASADDVVQRLKLSQGAPGALFMLDRELGARVPPVTLNTAAD
ncbi:MAG: Ferritin [Candidatus Hydrogenedentes bacterium ADurb.Bin101]|jgi:ferritin|nr:MAG: Ferritin [Candidatus Hydrogenedentes bacterium ADurb.Bin101]HOC67921.1 ferritin [Candidatus Hydrogenedentota bacterium]